jgi:hypothetical protein
MIKGRDLALHLTQHPEQSGSSENQNLDFAEHPWYKNLVYYLQFQKCLDYIDSHQRRRLCLEVSKYMILGNYLFRISADGLLLRCIRKS